LDTNFRDEPVIKNRNFDPITRTLRKHDRTEDAVMEDTVEKNVDGLAEKIIAEDEERRAQELVCCHLNLHTLFNCLRLSGYFQHCTKAAELGFKA
jgi:cwf18 pre-mRNA splicing factor